MGRMDVVNHIKWQTMTTTADQRAAIKQQRPVCLWLTGLSGAGKSTLANLLEQHFFALGKHTFVLDGDNLRHGLNADLGFSDSDRRENVRRVAHVARLMVDAGLIVIVSVISPLEVERDRARSLFATDDFLEIHVDAPLQVCEQRDTKGLYAKARRGELRGLTGIDSPYETPRAPEVRVVTNQSTPEECVSQIFAALKQRNHGF